MLTRIAEWLAFALLCGALYCAFFCGKYLYDMSETWPYGWRMVFWYALVGITCQFAGRVILSVVD